MPKRALRKTQASKQLLKTLTDSPALPAFVQSLQPPVLKRLIDRVGLRDAGALIALTTTEQMREIFEESLWESLTPGTAEGLRPERFIEWVDVMFEADPSQTARRLIELGDTFVALNLAPLVTVIDRTVAFEHTEGACHCVLCQLTARDTPFEVIDEYIVTGVHDDEWETVRNLLVELETEDAAFLHRVLARCTSAPTMREFAPDGETLLADETHAREQRRERRGFVTPEMAAAFLGVARRATRQALAAETGYDAISERYFARLADAAATRAKAASHGAEADAQAEDETKPVSPIELRRLESALVDAEIVDDRRPALLIGPTGPREAELELQAWLDRLQSTHPVAFATRLSELVFLANVLMSGSWHQGKRFTEVDAAKVALACANLGLELTLGPHAPATATARADAIAEILAARPGIVRLFRVGWNAIQALPAQSATALLDALRADHVRDQLRRKRWILEEIESALTDPDIFTLIEQGEFEDVGDTLVMLSLVLDPRACECLRTLISDVPQYPLQLEAGLHGHPASRPRTNATRHLATLRDLERIDAFLDEIDRHLKI